MTRHAIMTALDGVSGVALVACLALALLALRRSWRRGQLRKQEKAALGMTALAAAAAILVRGTARIAGYSTVEISDTSILTLTCRSAAAESATAAAWVLAAAALTLWIASLSDAVRRREA